MWQWKSVTIAAEKQTGNIQWVYRKKKKKGSKLNICWTEFLKAWAKLFVYSIAIAYVDMVSASDQCMLSGIQRMSFEGVSTWGTWDQVLQLSLSDASSWCFRQKKKWMLTDICNKLLKQNCYLK